MGVKASKLSRNLGWRLTRGWWKSPAPRGYIPVCVGVGDEWKRFMVHTRSFKETELQELLFRSAEEYGYRNDGVLRIPYDTKRFEERVLGRDGHRGQKVIVAA
uniref:Auxin-induced protein 10A5 n=1 Tax=Anthurium amnicola TaxID=1678845 RepID=A0A1D1YZS1_9ARAE